MAKRDYYEVLGVGRDADETEIKKSFRGLARRLHPDVNSDDPDAEERFKEAAEAYEVLSDPERRRTYDTYGHEGLRSGGYQSTAQGFGSFQDIFDAFFGGEGGGGGFGDIFGGGGRGGPAAGGDIGVLAEVELADVVTGVSREVEFEAVVACEHCRGNGAEPGTPIVTCETCEGAGQVRHLTRTPFGQMMRSGACPDCNGSGKIPETPCAVCDGVGRRRDTKTYEVDIPPGIETGQQIRVSGAGHEGESGARAGDLYVQVEVAEHPDFQRQGRDLITVVELPVTAAMLGAQVPVPTLDGSEQVEVEAGAQHGDTIKLRHQGLPAINRPSRGDLHVLLKLITPVELDDSQRELVEQLDATLGPQNEPRAARSGLFERMRKAFR